MNIKKFVFVVAGGFILVGGAQLMAQKNNPATYRITQKKGPTGILPKGAKVPSPAAVGLPLEAGDRIITGQAGGVELSTEDGTVLQLKEKSSLRVETISPKKNSFFMSVGTLLARFSKESPGRRYAVHTPRVIAAVRGTNLALTVHDDAQVEGGVVEGEVAFEPVSAGGGEEPMYLEDEETAEVVLQEGEGISVDETGFPVRLNEIPKVLVGSLDWFEHVQDRVKSIREQWGEWEKPANLGLREKSLKEQITWKVPDRLLMDFVPPQKAEPTFKAPAKRSPAKPNPPKPR